MLFRVFKPIDYKTYSNTVYYVFEPLIRYGLYVYIVTYFLPHKKNFKNTKKYKKKKIQEYIYLSHSLDILFLIITTISDFWLIKLTSLDK
jgi:hypothetical protein